MITREQTVEQSVQNFIREEMEDAGYNSGLLEIRDAFPTLAERATPMTKNQLAIGFNFDDGGRKVELGTDLTRRVYTIEFWVFGMSPEAGRNIAGVIRAVIEDARWLVPLVDLETDTEIDKLVVLDDRGITVQRQVTQEPRPWDHYVWTTTVKFEDFYLPGVEQLMASQNPNDFSYVLATVDLHVLEREAFRLSTTLDADGAKFQASEVRRAFFALLSQLKAIAVTVSQDAHQAIVDLEAASRVRPDTGGAGGARLQDYIGESNPLTAVEGSVGINDEAMLSGSPVYWWWTIEDGYDWQFHQESDIKGYFQPGNSAPGQAPSGTHPLFRAGGKGPQMVPQNAIAPRHFVRDGFIQAEGDWHGEIKAAKATFMAALRAALASAPPPRAPSRGRRP